MAEKRDSIVLEDGLDVEPDPRRENPPETADDSIDVEDSRQPPWPVFTRKASLSEIRARFASESAALLAEHAEVSNRYCCLTLFDPKGSIGSFEADRIYHSLDERNPGKAKNVLLLICSPGGSIEPAYHITKLCKRYAASRFVCAVPREAKSAATLIAIGADEVHMGPLSELGPIDPQIGGLPALGVKQALKTIASLSEQHPKSSQMFAQYLRMALTVEQIGYCERISESAVQYAERLLSVKGDLPKDASEIARDLVYEYKHHGFVIDSEEAQLRLGKQLVRTDTPEVRLADAFYSLFSSVDLWLAWRGHYLVAEGMVGEQPLILEVPDP